MKIAKEIAEDIYPITEDMRRSNPSWALRMERQRKIAIPLIAAKLEPVRVEWGKVTDCPARIRNAGCKFCDDAPACLDALIGALVLLSKEAS